MRVLTLSSEAGGLDQWKSAALAIPLIFVVLAAAFAATPEEYRPLGLSRLITGYPLVLELEEIEAETFARDQARAEEERLAAERAEELARATLRRLAAETVIQDVGAASPDPEDVVAQIESEDLPDLGDNGFGVDANADLLPIEFDLAGGPLSEGTIRVDKEVRDAQGVLGRIEVRIDNNSAIFVSSSDVWRVLPEREREALSLQQDFIPLSELRDGGVNLRYDPTEDRFVLLQ